MKTNHMNEKYNNAKSQLYAIVYGMRDGTIEANAIEEVIGKGEWSEERGMNIHPKPIGKAQQNILGRVLAKGDAKRMKLHQQSIDNSIEILATYAMSL